MSWVEAHKRSEELASTAHEAMRRGDRAVAESLFRQAANAEEQALLQLNAVEKPRTFGVTAVSAVALWYKAGDLSAAEAIAYQVLAHTHLQQFAVSQLRTLLQSVWNVRAQQAAGVRFVPGQVQVSVRGGEVVAGGAPLDLIVEKVQTIQALFYRTAEWLKQMPLRRHGPAPKEIQDSCRPWLFQGVPASYQFVVVIETPRQADWISPAVTDPQLVANTFLSILRNAADSPGEGLSRLVPDKEYKAAFLKLTRSLSPTGKVFGQMEICAAGDPNAVVLEPESRKAIAQTLRAEAPQPSPTGMTPTQLTGVLRAVHLDQDWIEVTVDGRGVRIDNVGEALDDVIGPMVNHPVVVQALRDNKGKFHFRDIERDE